MPSFNEIPHNFLLVLGIVGKTSVVLGVAWIAVLSMKRRNPRWRMFILRFAAMGVLAMPILVNIVPEIRIPILIQPVTSVGSEPAVNTIESMKALDAAPLQVIPTMQEANIINPPSTSVSQPVSTASRKPGWTMDPVQAILGIWVAGVWAVILHTLRGNWKIRRFLQKSAIAPDFARKELDETCDLMGIRQSVELRCLPEALTPFLFGILRPTIVLPPRIVEEEFRGDLPAILAHELAHVRSRDLAWKACFRIVQALFWFNPFAWLVRFSHDSVCEELSDAKAALYVGDTESYSQTLARVTLDLLLNPPVYAGLSMAHLPEIRRRLEILKWKIRWSPLSRSLSYSFLLMGAMAMTGLAGFQAVDRTVVATPKDENAVKDPFQLGEKWIYQHGGNRTIGDVMQPVVGDRVQEITGQTIENGKPLWLITETWGETDYDPWRFFVDGERLLRKVESGAEIVRLNNPFPFDWLNLQPGESKRVKSGVIADTFTGAFTIDVQRLENETIAVPAGDYPDCIKVKMTIDYSISLRSGSPLVFHHIYWYHPKVNGVVKESFEYKPAEGNPISGVSMLKSHTVPESKESASMNLEIHIERLPPLRVARFHAMGETPETKAWNTLKAWAEPLGLLKNPQKNLVFGFNNPNPSPGQKDYGYEFWIAVGSDIQSTGDVEFKDFPGGTYAAAKNVKLADVGQAYPALWSWLEDSPHKWRKSNELEKIQNPGAPEEEMLLDLYIPIEE